MDQELAPNTSTVSRLQTFRDLIDLHIADMCEVGKPPRRSKAATLTTLKRDLGKEKIRHLDRSEPDRLRQGAGPVTGLLPGERPPAAEAARILGFGGNAWDADVLAIYLRSLFPDREIVTFNYRGYGRSAGRPSADAILEDAERIHDAVIPAFGGGMVVVVGLSLGAGPAAHLASRRPVEGVILVTPFDSIEALAADLYPWLPTRLLLRHRMDVAGALARSSASVAIFSAERDDIVPPRRTEALRRSASDPVLDRVIPGAGTTTSTTASSSSRPCARPCPSSSDGTGPPPDATAPPLDARRGLGGSLQGATARADVEHVLIDATLCKTHADATAQKAV